MRGAGDMKRKTRKTLFSTLVVTLIFTAIMSVATAVLPIKQTLAATETTGFKMVEGASIRTTDPLGLRFIAELGQQEYTDLTTPENGVTKKMGMFIMPWSYISENDEIITTDYSSVETKLDYVFYSSDGTVDNKIYEYENKNGEIYYRANGVISNLKLQNYAKEFVGIGYIAETENGVTTYMYTDVCKEDNVRSSAYVAIEAHADSDYAENTKALSAFEKYIDGAQLHANWGLEQVDGGYKYGGTTYSTIEEVKEAIGNFEYSLTLDKSVKYVKENGTAQLTATVNDVSKNVNFDGAHVVYSSSDEEVVTVDQNGKLTFKKNGVATVTAEFAGAKQTCEVISGVIDFSDGKLPAFIQNGGRASLSVVDGNGGKVLQATSENNDQGNVRIMMPLTYVGAFFEDENVQFMAFDLKLPEGATTGISSVMYHNLDQTNYTAYETTQFDTVPTDAAKSYYLPRSVYEAWVANNKTEGRFLNVQAGITQGASYWIDNIRAVTEADYTADLYSFETGSLRKNMSDGPGFCTPNYNQFHLKITGADASTAKFTNDRVSDGMRAIQFTKQAGESVIMFNASSDPSMETEMREAGYVSFDLYVPEGSDAKIKHNNQAWYGALKQGWNTIYERVPETDNNLIRFVDTTASTYVIDNFRLLTEDEYNKAKFGFEAGGVLRDNNANNDTVQGWTYYYAGWDKANNKASIQIMEGSGTADVATLSNVRFETKESHSGDYSLAFDKKAGWMVLSMASDSEMCSLLKNGFTFWVYSTTAMNGTSDVEFVNGNGAKFNGGAGVSIEANTWTKVTVTASDLHSTAYRFLILQKNTAGTVYIDDIKPLEVSNITYDAGTLGAVANATQSIVVGESYTLETPTAYRDFLGWYNGDELVPMTGTWNVDGDVTLTARYADTLSFDDGVLPTYMTKDGSTESLSVVEEDGEKVLQIKSTANTYNPIMNVTLDFVASFFEDTDVDYIAFEAKAGSSKTNNFRRSQKQNDTTPWGYVTYEYSIEFNGIDTTYKTFFFTRADYDYWKEYGATVGAFIYANGVNGGDSIYVDNIRPATQEEYELKMYSFGSGGVRKYSDIELFFYSPLTSISDRTFGMLLETGNAFTNIGYVENGTDGNRAFQFTKEAGNVQLNFPSDKNGYTTIVTKTGYYAVDIYIPANSDAEFTYHEDSWNGARATKGAWNTFYGKGNNVVQWTDTTGGTYLVDNIRVITQEEYENALANVEPVYNWYNAEVGETDGDGVVNGITFNASTHTNASSTILPQPTDTEDMSYYHFGGDYGLNDFLVFDFTGNNVPILSFFNTAITNTVYNHAEDASVKGWIVANGITNSDGTPHSGWTGAYANRINLIGSYKISYKFDDNGSGTATLSQVRAAVGSDSLATMAKLNGSTDKYRIIVGWVDHPTKANAMSLRVVAWNLTTQELIVDFTEGEVSKADWTGDIALYGHFGRTTAIDKLYPVVSGLDNALDLYTPDTVRYNTRWEGDDLILGASTYEGTVTSPTSADMSYIAFNGTYGMNDFVVFDFTGDNMPFVSFFNNRVTNTVFNNAVDTSVKGWVIGNGLYQNDGTIYDESGVLWKRLGVFGPNKLAKYDETKTGQFRSVCGDANNPNPLSIYKLQDATDTYRVIIGLVSATGRNDKHFIQIGVINMTTGEVVYELNESESFVAWTTEYTEGSIALHGQFGKETRLDRVIGVEENTTLDALIEKYAVKDADYSDESAVELDRYGYASLSNGQWQIDGVNQVTNPTDHRATIDAYNTYKNAGFNIVLAQDMIEVDVEESTWATEGKKYMDLAHQAGLKVILTDWHLQILSKPISVSSSGISVANSNYVPWIIGTDASATTGLAKEWIDIVSEQGWTMDTARFASRDALDNYVRAQLALYKDHPAFYGVMLADEPSYHSAYCYGEIYKSIKRVMPECYVQYNLCPMEQDTAAIERFYTGEANNDATSEQIETAYRSYVEKFLDALGTDYIQYDDYPFKSATDGMWFWETTTPYVDPTSLRNIQLIAELAKERGLDVKVVTQSCIMKKGGTDGEVLIRQITEDDARWLNNYLMGFGVKQINYFTYWPKFANSTSGEYFEGNGSFINRDGTTTDLYDFMKTIMANNTAFAPTISHFDYNASKVVSNSYKYSDDHIVWGTMTNDSFKFVNSVTTSTDATLVTELYDKDNYNYMYMVMNTIDPYEKNTNGKDTSQTITVTFDGTFDMVYVYDQTGARTSVQLTNNTYTVTLTAGQAVYLLPY